MLAWLILILLGAIWGSSYLCVKIIGAEIPAFTFVEARTLVAASVLLVILHLRKESIPRKRQVWMLLFVMGFFNSVIPYTAIIWGETHITSSVAAILAATLPLFTAIFAHLWTQDDKLNAPRAAGIVLGFIGVVVLFVPELPRGIQVKFWSELAIVVAAASTGLATLIAHKYLSSVSHVMAATGQLAFAALIVLPFSLVFDNPFTLHPSFEAIGTLLILALPNTALAYILYFWLIEHTGATRTALVSYLIPITGIFWGSLLLSEKVSWEAIAGLVLIVGGIGLVNNPRTPPADALGAAPAQDE